MTIPSSKKPETGRPLYASETLMFGPHGSGLGARVGGMGWVGGRVGRQGSGLRAWVSRVGGHGLGVSPRSLVPIGLSVDDV